MPIFVVKKKGGGMLKTGQTTVYSGEADDGSYQKGIAKAYTILTTGQYAGNTNIDLQHLSSTTGSFTASSHTYADTGKCGVFKAAGGETVVISGSSVGANNGTFTTASATADAVVMTTGLADASAGDTIVIQKREAHANACVLDLNTGLMWNRTYADKMGPAGNGVVRWTGVDYDAFAYVAAANTALLSGYSDWRLPNINELFSLADHEAPNSAPDSTAFPTWAGIQPWSSTTTSGTTANAQCVAFAGGAVQTIVKTNETTNRVVLVRGG